MWQTKGYFGAATEENGTGSPTGIAQKTPMMRVSRLKTRAVVSDIMSSTTRIRVAHAKGYNVLYADGSARWVDVGVVKNQDDGTSALLDPARPTGPQSGLGSGFKTSNNRLVDMVWKRFDDAI